MAWFVYVIKSEIDGRLYKGMSEDVSARLVIHNKGKVSSTKAYRPGWLKHIGGGEELACELAFYFDIDARSVGPHEIAGSAGDEHLVKVQFFETILRRAY